MIKKKPNCLSKHYEYELLIIQKLISAQEWYPIDPIDFDANNVIKMK